MKKEMKALAIVLAAFALILCLASCESDTSKDYSFATFIRNLENADDDPSKMPKTPIYVEMSDTQLNKFNADLSAYLKASEDPSYEVASELEEVYNLAFELVKAHKEGDVFMVFLVVCQDKYGNWHFLGEGDL